MAFPSLFIAFGLLICIGHAFGKWYWGPLFEIYDRYERATSRFDHHRADKWLTAIFVTAAVPLGVLCWDTGEAIGSNGIVYKSGLSVHYYSFDQITEIGRYSQYHAPVGIVDMANLRLRFNDGATVSIRKARGQAEATALDTVATFISNRSRVPIKHGETPPP